MAYLDLETDVKPYLGIETANTADDELLEGFITTAQAIIEAPSPVGTGRRFEAAADTIRRFDAIADLDVADRRTLVFWDDLAQITSVINGDSVAVAAGDYIGIPASGPPWYGLKLKRSSSVAWTYADSPEGSIVITGRWAYSLTPPADIKHIALRIVAWLYRQKDGSVEDQPIQTPNGIILPAAFPPDIRLFLEGYRSWV